MASIRRPGLAVALAILALAAGAAAASAAASPHAPAPPSGAVARAAGASDPTCTPQTLDASALLDGAVTVSPMPGAADASPVTQISFLGVPASALSELVVSGSVSGPHTGTLEPYSQGDGGSFVPAQPFVAGETVSVSAQLTLGGAAQPLGFQFTIAQEDPLSDTQERQNPLPRAGVQSFVSRPDLLPPLVSVHVDSPRAAAGDLLLAPYGVPAQAGPMILDPAGRLVWFHPLAAPLAATNLRVQQFDGQPVLTWWQGTITVHGFGLGEDVIAGSHYQTIAEVRAGNGYQADLHEFQLTPSGTALLTAYNSVHCDLYALGGNREAAVTDSLLQEIDIRTGLVMYEWDSLDHIALTDSYANLVNATATAPFDFFHLNSINLDPDGTLLVSSRNTWALDDIDAATGQLVWTLGGKHSSFSEGRGAATAFQHDARPAGAGAFSVFDNGASPQVHAQSRGVVLTVDTQTHTVSVATQYLHSAHPLLAESQGDMQALPNGDWFVGWGQVGELSEFSAAGSLLFDASLPPGYESYRSLRFAWNGLPLDPPALALRGGDAYVSWNGATGVTAWELLEGSSAGRLRRVRVLPHRGFETQIALAADPRYRFAAVRALGPAGTVLGSSATVALPAGAPAGG